MRQLKRIIVGHDLRAGGEAALQSAAVLAHRSGAALKLVHVVEPYPLYQRISHPFTPPHTLEELAQKAGEKLEALAARAELAPLRVEYEVRTGKPFVELIIACRVWQADLIVVGGTAQREAHLLGSTSAQVVRKALVPVLVAKRPLTAGAKTFLVPTDFSSCASKAAEEALALAESFGGRVFFFHALDLSYLYTPAYGLEMATLPPIPPLTAEDIEGEWQAFLSGLPALKRVSWDKRTEEGRAATSIVQQAGESQADVIVIGTHGSSGLAHMLLGSVAEEVVRTAPCPILTVRPEAFQFELP